MTVEQKPRHRPPTAPLRRRLPPIPWDRATYNTHLRDPTYFNLRSCSFLTIIVAQNESWCGFKAS